jgi:hypothetical protein
VSTQPPPSTWAEWEAALGAALRRLPDGDSVVVAAGEAAARMARPRSGGGLRRLLVPVRKRPLVPSVRLARAEDHLRGYCVGPERRGGDFPWTPEEDAALLALGWHHGTSGDGDDYVRFWPDDVPEGPYLPEDDARRAARAVARTFREVVGVGEDDLPSLRG